MVNHLSIMWQWRWFFNLIYSSLAWIYTFLSEDEMFLWLYQKEIKWRASNIFNMPAVDWDYSKWSNYSVTCSWYDNICILYLILGSKHTCTFKIRVLFWTLETFSSQKIIEGIGQWQNHNFYSINDFRTSNLPHNLLEEGAPVGCKKFGHSLSDCLALSFKHISNIGGMVGNTIDHVDGINYRDKRHKRSASFPYDTKRLLIMSRLTYIQCQCLYNIS